MFLLLVNNFDSNLYKFTVYFLLLHAIRGTVVGKDLGVQLIPGYSIGRLAEGQFEYPRLNGWMTPVKAADICEEDLMCAGFTYKGSLITDKKYDIYFFHLAVNVEENRDSWKWIYYKVNRQYSTFPGVFTNEKFTKSKTRWRNNRDKDWHLVDVVDAERQCLVMRGRCVGFIHTKNKTKAVIMDYIDMDTFVETPNKVTKLKLAGANSETNIEANSSWSNLNLCCPKSEKVNLKKLLEEVHDNVKRISCDIPKEEFLETYVKRRQVVVLVNCSRDWYAQKHWTIDKLLNQGGGKALWTADVEVKNMSSTKAGWFKKYTETEFPIAGNILQQIMEYNGTIKVFDAIGKRKHAALKKKFGGRAARTDKTYLFEEYRKPQPMPRDYFELSGILTDYQWIIFSQGNTGTELHTDPDYTDPWNTLISGHKWWTFLPPDVQPDHFLCNEKCSKGGTDEEISTYSWYTHVVPQLRNRVFYGGSIQNLLQRPGETIFLPGHLAHSVMNLEETVSVTENYNLVSNLVDFVHGLMIGEGLLNSDHVDGAGDEMKDAEKLWKALYNKHMDKEGRNVMREMRRQVELMARVNPDACNEDDEEDEDDDEDEDEDEDDEDI